jgi:hypothetical protein
MFGRIFADAPLQAATEQPVELIDKEQQTAVEQPAELLEQPVVEQSAEPIEQPKPYPIITAPFDARFPNCNQTKHCWQNYIDYFNCVNAKGDDSAACSQFKRNYHSLCPPQWVSCFNLVG